MLIITHRLRDASDFLDRYLPEGSGGFFLRSKLGMPKGARICLELILPWLCETHYLYARVQQVGLRWESCGETQTGVIVRLEAHEALIIAGILERVRASVEAVQARGSDRIDLNLLVRYFDDQRSREGQVLNLSPSGAYIRAPSPFPTGSDLHLRFEDRKRGVMRHIRGRVVRLDLQGRVAGMGVSFHLRGWRERRGMQKLCRQYV